MYKSSPIQYWSFVLLLALFSMYANSTTAQDQLNHEKGSYVDSMNRYYHQADLPLYLYVSHQPSQSPQQLGVRPDGEQQPSLTPIQLDGHGVHFLKHEDVVHKHIEKFPIYGDGIAPKTELRFSGADQALVGETLFFGRNLEVELSATDEMSGLQEVYHSVNEAAYQTYQQADFSKGGEYVYSYYSVDKVGNVEAANQKRFTVDVDPPSTDLNITGKHEEAILAFSAMIQLKAEDAMSGVNKTYYQINRGEWKLYTSEGIGLQDFDDGDYELRYFSIDRVNNYEDTTLYAFYLDRTSPIVTADILGDKFIVGGETYFSGRTKLKLTSVDNKAGVDQVRFSIDGKEPQIYDQPFYLPDVSGRHSISYFATDHLGNKGVGDDGMRVETYNHTTTRVYLDLVGPDLFYAYEGASFQKGDTMFIHPETRIALSAKDQESGLQSITYQINDAIEETPFDQPFSLREPGVYKVDYAGYDNVNNRNTSQFLCVVDNESPLIEVTFSVEPQMGEDGLPVIPAYAGLYLSASDRHTGIKEMYYQLGEQKEKPYAGEISGFKAGTTYTLTVRAVDKLGNTEVHTQQFMTK